MALNLNNNTDTSLASHSCENSFVLKHECEAKDVLSIAIQIQAPFMQRIYVCCVKYFRRDSRYVESLGAIGLFKIL